MPRKKTTPEEDLEQNANLEQGDGASEAAAVEEGGETPAASATEFSEIPSGDGMPEAGGTQREYVGVSEELPAPPENGGAAAGQLPGPLATETPVGSETAVEGGSAPPPEKSDRQNFYELNFNEMDRGLTAEERQEWNSIYASYRGRSALTDKIIGVDPLSISVRNRQTGDMEGRTMYCAVAVPYRVRIVIPASEMWEGGQERPDFVLQNMVGAMIDFIIIKVDRESGFAIASRRMAARSQRYFFTHRPALHREGARAKCRVLSVGPRRCLVECYGHDINLTFAQLYY